MIVTIIVNMVYKEGNINAQCFAFINLIHSDCLCVNQNGTNTILYSGNGSRGINIHAALFQSIAITVNKLLDCACTVSMAGKL